MKLDEVPENQFNSHGSRNEIIQKKSSRGVRRNIVETMFYTTPHIKQMLITKQKPGKS